MLAAPLRKNKINLSDYNFQKDIELRLIMSNLNVFEVNLLTEIVQGSLKIKINQLAQHLEVEVPSLLSTLEKLQPTQLFQIEKDIISVNKDMRKYWENQIPRFSDDFRAGMEFLKDLLSKVPIHILPTWYAIPRSSDDIFSSIVEKYFFTPKIYKRYLNDLCFDEPILSEMMKDVFEAPDYKIEATTLIAKYALSREKFEEFMLQLEFNFVCCLSYNQIGSNWVEIVTPFHEWRQHLRFQRDFSPKPLEDLTKIARHHPNDFGFVQEVTRLVLHLNEESIALQSTEKAFAISEKLKIDLFPHQGSVPTFDQLIHEAIKRGVHLQLFEVRDKQLLAGKMAPEWTEKHIQEQAITIYRSAISENNPHLNGYIDKELKETEKCLKKIAPKGWIYFDEFLKVCTAPIGANEPVILKKTGKRWKYQVPEYKEQDIEKFRIYIFKILFFAGITATGSHEGRPCFCLTPFGRMSLD